jgi:hypothetical protein
MVPTMRNDRLKPGGIDAAARSTPYQHRLAGRPRRVVSHACARRLRLAGTNGQRASDRNHSRCSRPPGRLTTRLLRTIVSLARNYLEVDSGERDSAAVDRRRRPVRRWIGDDQNGGGIAGALGRMRRPIPGDHIRRAPPNAGERRRGPALSPRARATGRPAEGGATQFDLGSGRAWRSGARRSP